MGMKMNKWVAMGILFLFIYYSITTATGIINTSDVRKKMLIKPEEVDKRQAEHQFGMSGYPLKNEVSCEISSYTKHSPIFITGNDDFTPQNGVISGNGTKENPYIIEGWEIKCNAFWKMLNNFLSVLEHSRLPYLKKLSAGIPVCGICIKDTNKHVVIINNYIHGWKSPGLFHFPRSTEISGIRIVNVSNITIGNNVLENNHDGIHMGGHSNNVSIRFNNFIANEQSAITLWHTYNGSIMYNNISESTMGILCSSSRLYVAYNNIYYNSNGVLCDQHDFSVIENNFIVDNGNGIYCPDGNPFISTNTIGWNEAGIFITQGQPIISNNTIIKNWYGIMSMGRRGRTVTIIDNIISNNSWDGITIEGPAIIKHNIISSNDWSGIIITGDASIEHNIISSNSDFGIGCIPDELSGKVYAPRVHYNNILDNGREGIRYGETIWNVTINATYNYWGSADGPSGYGNGSGDEVDKNIIFEPWLAEPVPDAGPR